MSAVLLAGCTSESADARDMLEALLKHAKTTHYVAVSAPEARIAQTQFGRLLGAETRDQALDQTPAWHALGFELLTPDGSDYAVLREREDHRQGRGVYTFRPAPRTPVLLQAPHQYHDLQTGVITRQLFLEHPMTAAAWNNAHRYLTADSDLARTEYSFFHTLGLAFAQAYPQGMIIQLHGFDATSRPQRKHIQAIISNGTRTPSPMALALTRCMTERMHIQAKLYPRDTDELGATRNSLGRALSQQNFNGFLHLELDKTLRQRLSTDKNTRRQLIDCIMETLR